MKKYEISEEARDSIIKAAIEVKRAYERSRREFDKATGALEQFEREMWEKYGTKTTNELATEVTKLLKEEHELIDQLEEKLKAFEAKWESKLG